MGKNKINARRVRILNLNTFNCLNDKEDILYDTYKKAKKEQREILKELYLNTVKEFSGVRVIDKKYIYKSKNGELTTEFREDKQIALFESELMRLANDFSIEFPLVQEVIYLDIYHNEILKQIIYNGIVINDKKYIVYSSSTNQQKKSMITLLDEEFYNKNVSKIMCGLSIDKINKKGGCNRGKYLAYTSLPMSSSVELSTIYDENKKYAIDIDKCIVVKDFETIVKDKVNYLDVHSFDIEPKIESIRISHMDGSGIFLPGVLPSSGQIRGGWFKGAVFPFDFVKYINEKDGNPIIEDIWGDPVNVIEQDIQLLLTGSQLKMWKYYDNWNEYKTAFKENNRDIYINNLAHEPEEYATVRLSYQFLQTLPRFKFTDEMIERLCSKSMSFIVGAKKNIDIMFSIMGTKEDKTLEPLQAALKLYPNMLSDNYVQKKIRDAVNAEQNKARSGKVIVDGFYSYICPDLYAFCEWLFCGVENPVGLIPKNYVYNAYYNDKEINEVDCLRSPHLSDAEHAIRKLVKSDECKEWFSGTDTIVSSHDLISKTLMNDWDGDECLITSSKELIDLIDKDKLPLYYEMSTSASQEINNNGIYEALCSSFQNSIIGKISNAITKLYNTDDKLDLKLIRILTCYNNYMIDFPKTQYELPLGDYKDIYEELIENDKIKVPYFFRYAKGKKETSCEKINDSNVNKVCKYINKAMRLKENKEYELFKNDEVFNPTYLLNDAIEVKKDHVYTNLRIIIRELKLQSRFMEGTKLKKVNRKLKTNEEFDEKYLNYDLFHHLCQDKILNLFNNNRNKAANYLAYIEYFEPENQTNNKNILWNCFGDIIVDNIKINLNKPDLPKMKRNAYQVLKAKDKANFNIINKAIKEEIAIKSVDIYKGEYEWVEKQQHRKDCTNDRLLLFIFLYLHKKYAKEGKFRIYINSKTNITPNVINNWTGADVCKRGIVRLQKKELIECKVVDRKYYEIKLLLPKSEVSEIVFTIANKNPLVPLFKFTEERKIKQCSICKTDFIAVGNSKTCKESCKKMLENNTKRQNNKKIS